MRIGYLECFSGISGDMLLGALVDAGVPFSLLEETAAALNVGARLEMRKVMRGGLSATKVDVLTPEQSHAEHSHQHEGDGHSPEHDHEHPHQHPHEHSHEPHTHEHLHGETAHDHAAHEHHSHDAHKHEEHGREAHSHDEHEQHDHGHAAHRSLSTILAVIEAAPLAERVKQRATRAFRLLGEAGKPAIHSIPIEKVHFHEVGAVDTIVLILCAPRRDANRWAWIAGWLLH